MKSTSAVAISILLACSFAAPAQSTTDVPRLLGIAKLPKRTCVMLEVPRTATSSETMILGAGERQHEVEVISVTPELGSATLNFRGSNVVVTLGFAIRVTNDIDLTNAPLRATLQLFGELSGRTLLPHPALPNVKFAIRASVANQESAAQVFVQALADQAITVINDGEKFAMVVPKAAAATVQPRSDQISIPLGDAVASTNLIPAGMMVMNGADCWQMAPLYAGFIDRKLDPASRTLPMPPFFFRNQTALTSQEFIYAFETMFAWRGYKLVPADDKLAKLVRIEPK